MTRPWYAGQCQWCEAVCPDADAPDVWECPDCARALAEEDEDAERRAELERDYGPDDDPDGPWSGGIAENH